MFQDSVEHNYLTRNDFEDSLMLNQLYDNDQLAEDDPVQRYNIRPRMNKEKSTIKIQPKKVTTVKKVQINIPLVSLAQSLVKYLSQQSSPLNRRSRLVL